MRQGTRGLLISPRHPAQFELARPGAQAEAAAIFAPRRYLVDPDPLTRAQLVTHLRDKGFGVVEATDLEAALPPVDALIVALDCMEPGANRPRWLMAKPGMPTIVLDRSHVFPGRTTRLGFTPDARLSLPIQPRKLVATLRRVLSLVRIESVDPGEASVRSYHFAGWTLHCQQHRLEAREGARSCSTSGTSRC